MEKYIGKKRENDEIINNKNELEKKSMEIDETKEESNFKYKNDKEIMKLKLVINNLKTENSLLKYRLNNSQESDNNQNIIQKNDTITKLNSLENKECTNNNKLEMISKENEEKIKQLEEENNNLKLNIVKNNIDINSPYNFLIKELDIMSKNKCELESKIDTLIKEKKDIINKYAYINLENENLKNEINLLKNKNKNLDNEIEKFKFDDLEKKKEEIEKLKSKISELEKDKKENNEKLDEFKKKFNHDYGNSKKIRLILNYLMHNTQIMESKIKEFNIYKEKNEKMQYELQKEININKNLIELKSKTIEEDKKKLGEEKFKYEQLRKEFNNLVEISKENNNAKDSNDNSETQSDKLKRSFSHLFSCLDKYKTIVPVLYNKLENIEKENKKLKEQINNKTNIENNNKNYDAIINKDKEIEELKNEIKKISNEKDNLLKEQIIMKTENSLMKDDFISIGNTIASTSNINEKGNNENENLMNELLAQLMKARNIISFYENEKK